MNSKSFDEVFDTLPAAGWLSEDEAKLLWSMAEQTEGPILEVGCFRGRSTVLLAAFGRPVCCVDPFDNFSTDFTGDQIRDMFLMNLEARGIRDVILYRTKIEDWEPTGTFGLTYLDGDHTYQGTLDQIEVALKCRPTVIAIHDVNDSGGGLEVKRAAVELLGAWDERVERLAVWRT